MLRTHLKKEKELLLFFFILNVCGARNIVLFMSGGSLELGLELSLELSLELGIGFRTGNRCSF